MLNQVKSNASVGLVTVKTVRFQVLTRQVGGFCTGFEVGSRGYVPVTSVYPDARLPAVLSWGLNLSRMEDSQDGTR
jgi:hypothetical protein